MGKHVWRDYCAVDVELSELRSMYDVVCDGLTAHEQGDFDSVLEALETLAEWIEEYIES